jgi:plastocyanin
MCRPREVLGGSIAAVIAACRWSRSARRASAAAGAAVLLGLPASAMADKEIRAGPVNRFQTPDVTMDQGEKVTFRNLDINRHNVFASANGPDGQPWFKSATISQNETALVDGAQYLTTGDYQFICNIHPFMEGTLHVTGNGTPQPRPGAAATPTADATAPNVSVRLASARQASVRRNRELNVTVRVDEAATVSLRATTVSHGKTVTLGRGKVKFAAEGSRRRALSLTSAGRKALDGRRGVTVKVIARAVDTAGNVGKATRSKRLKP